MQIIVNPNDIIERCLWDKYVRFCLKDESKNDIDKIIKNNKPISLSEEDAYVIGLLKVIKTDNLVHRFNEDMIENLQIKSSMYDDQLFVKKSAINKQIDSYLNKFPDSYEPPLNYKESLNDLKDYIKKIQNKVSKLSITNIKRHDINIPHYNSKEIRKILDL